MFLGMCAVALIIAIPLTGGRLSRLGELRARGLTMLLVALAIQVVVTSVWPTMPHAVAVAGSLLSYAMLGLVLWWNRRLPGMVLIAIGAGTNAVVSAINGGTLPASAAALRAAGIHARAGFDNSGVLRHPHLSWLGDIFVTPGWLPLRNTMSIGDLVLLAGAAVLVVRTTRHPKVVMR